MAVSVGTAYVSIIPSTKGFAKSIEREVKPDATGKAMGKKTGKSFSSGFTKSLGGLAAARRIKIQTLVEFASRHKLIRSQHAKAHRRESAARCIGIDRKSREVIACI